MRTLQQCLPFNLVSIYPLGQQSTCWSPGVRDLDCANQGYCCFNGCANVCEGDGIHAAPLKTYPPEPVSAPAKVTERGLIIIEYLLFLPLNVCYSYYLLW